MKSTNEDKKNMLKEIKGVLIEKIAQYNDSRGWLAEIYRDDEDSICPKMSYVSHTDYNQVRGPHEHANQTDFFIFIGYGDFELSLWDNRKESETYKNMIKIVVGESNKIKVIIPPGVVHGYRSISKSGSLSINLPDKLYAGRDKKEKVDEIRYENDNDSEFKIV